MSFSENLKTAREKAHLTQRDLAKRSGVSQQAISVIEQGERSPSETTMKMLADALGCSISELIEDETSENKNGYILTVEEMQLIKDYRNLNRQGQEYIRQTMYMALPIYKRDIDIPRLENNA